jgi:hypothetical protein
VESARFIHGHGTGAGTGSGTSAHPPATSPATATDSPAASAPAAAAAGAGTPIEGARWERGRGASHREGVGGHQSSPRDQSEDEGGLLSCSVVAPPMPGPGTPAPVAVANTGNSSGSNSDDLHGSPGELSD